MWRRGRDSNPREAGSPYAISSRARSSTPAPLHSSTAKDVPPLYPAPFTLSTCSGRPPGSTGRPQGLRLDSAFAAYTRLYICGINGISPALTTDRPGIAILYRLNLTLINVRPIAVRPDVSFISASLPGAGFTWFRSWFMPSCFKSCPTL